MKWFSNGLGRKKLARVRLRATQDLKRDPALLLPRELGVREELLQRGQDPFRGGLVPPLAFFVLNEVEQV